MQLFSVGLIELTEDGAYERDGFGAAHRDVRHFRGDRRVCKVLDGLLAARAGAATSTSRGTRAATGSIRCRIRGNGHDSKRDLFPKTNLLRRPPRRRLPALRGPAGPALPLAKGARWSFIGHAPGRAVAAGGHPRADQVADARPRRRAAPLRPQLALDAATRTAVRSIPRIRLLIPSTSPLYQQLCGNARCRRRAVQLDERGLPAVHARVRRRRVRRSAPSRSWTFGIPRPTRRSTTSECSLRVPSVVLSLLTKPLVWLAGTCAKRASN